MLAPNFSDVFPRFPLDHTFQASTTLQSDRRSPCCHLVVGFFHPCRSRGALRRGKGLIESAIEGAPLLLPVLPSVLHHFRFLTCHTAPSSSVPSSLSWCFRAPVFASLHSPFAPSPPLFAPSPYLFAHSHPFFRSPPPHLPIRGWGSGRCLLLRDGLESEPLAIGIPVATAVSKEEQDSKETQPPQHQAASEQAS